MYTLNKKNNYTRMNGVLYENNIPIIQFTKHNFPDWGTLGNKALEYMQKYMRMYPKYWQPYEKKEIGQITLAL